MILIYLHILVYVCMYTQRDTHTFLQISTHPATEIEHLLDKKKKSQKAFIARDETFQNLPLMAKISLTIQLMQTISLAIKLEKFLIFFLTFFHWFCTPFT